MRSVNNDFHDSKAIFEIFNGLELDWKELTSPFHAEPAEENVPAVNGDHSAPAVSNGVPAQSALAA